MFRGQLAEISNREDLELILQAIDDDTQLRHLIAFHHSPSLQFTASSEDATC